MLQTYGTFPFPPPRSRETPLTANKMLGRVIKHHLQSPRVLFCLSLLKNNSLIAVYSININSLDVNFQPLQDGWAFAEILLLMIYVDVYLVSTLRQLHGYLMPSYVPRKASFQPFGTNEPVTTWVYLLASHIYLALHLTMAIRGWMRFHEIQTFTVSMPFTTTMFGVLGLLSVLNALSLAGSIISHFLNDRRPIPLSEVASPVPWRRPLLERQVWHPHIHVLGRPYRVSREAVFQALDPTHYFM
ncbi:hypothetical protein V8F20_008870 [Naviculisporaceae sp. PSN 640]